MALVRGSMRWGRALTAFLCLWLVCLVYFAVTTMTRTGEAEAALKARLEQALQEKERLVRDNVELRNLLREAQDKLETAGAEPVAAPAAPAAPEQVLSQKVSRAVDGPSMEYEEARRRSARDVREMWWFFRANLQTILQKADDQDEVRRLAEDALAGGRHRKAAALASIEAAREADGHDAWRTQESRELSDLVQARLRHLQEPADCPGARKLHCNLNKGCGYGCQVHHAVYCFVVAYGTERTLVLKSSGWRYDRKGWEDVFMPLSQTCSHPNVGSKKSWPASADTPVVDLGIIDSVNPRPKFLPPAVPADLAPRIRTLHGDPSVWWVAQFLKFMLRPQEDLAKALEEAEEANGFASPIVGIHIRRTDKVGTEAAFHGVEEYMKYVEEWFEEWEVRTGKTASKRRVFVASDDPKVLKELRNKFPDYTFSGDAKVAKTAAVSTRYNTNSLRGIITDIHLLSRTDFLVCTFSSQVCRIAYEIMQNYHVDAADRFKSLDDIWYFGGQDEHQQEAVMEHKSRGKAELELKVGDLLGVAGNHWNGFNKGKDHRSGRTGLYPEYKTREVVKAVQEFPTYPNVKS